jgi:hypothetical protein
VDGVGCCDFSNRASGKTQRPHLQRLFPEYLCEGVRRYKFKMLQGNRVRVRRSHRSGVSHTTRSSGGPLAQASILCPVRHRLPFALDPLMAEAKRRARQRRFLIALVALALIGGAAGAVAAFRSPGGPQSSLPAALGGGSAQGARNSSGSVSPSWDFVSLPSRVAAR